MLNLFKPHKILPKDPDYEKLRHNFAWLPAKTVRETIENSTQWYQTENRHLGSSCCFLLDSAGENRSSDIEDLERNYNIKWHHYSEPDYQIQNWVEDEIDDVKDMVNNVMDITGTPACYWLICTLYIFSILQIIS